MNTQDTIDAGAIASPALLEDAIFKAKQADRELAERLIKANMETAASRCNRGCKGSGVINAVMPVQKEIGKDSKGVMQHKSLPYIKARIPGRNQTCPCGSGKKFKACCIDRGAAALPSGQAGQGSWGQRPCDCQVPGLQQLHALNEEHTLERREREALA